MDAKLNHSDLSALFAKEANISGNKAEAFTKAVFDLIIEGLEKEGVVKINGLGTFKVADVASRSSVNVNTGEKFEIKGHKKLTFIPAESLKDDVNQPFAMFEPVEVDESYQEEAPAQDNDNESDSDANGDTVVEIASTAVTEITEETPLAEQEVQPMAVPVAEIEEEMPATEQEVQHIAVPVAEIEEEMPAAEQEVQPIAVPVAEIEEEMPAAEAKEEQTVITPAVEIEEEMTAEETENAEEVIGNDDENHECTELPVDSNIEEPVAIVQKSEEIQPEQKEEHSNKQAVATVMEEEATKVVAESSVKMDVADNRSNAATTAIKGNGKKKGALWTMLIFLVAIIIIGINRFGNTDTESAPTETSVAKEVKTEDVAKPQQVEKEEPIIAQVEEVEQPYSFVLCEELAALDLKKITVADTTLYVSTGELATHIVAADETLTKIALNYFGDKKLWPYIVKYNNLARPDDLCKGMEIVIPKLKPIR